MNKGSLIWVTGYFGAGKSTLTQAAIANLPNIEFVKVFTTRKQRPNEIGTGKGELEFVTKEEYEQLRSQSKKWDHSEVAENYYGTDVTDINARMGNGQSFICPVVPEISILEGMKKLYGVPPKLIWIDTPLEVANERVSVSRPERVTHTLQNEATGNTMRSYADHIFTPIGELEEDTANFNKLIQNIFTEY